MNVFFIGLDYSVESVGKEIVDVRLPYERIELINFKPFVTTENHMVFIWLFLAFQVQHGMRHAFR